MARSSRSAASGSGRPRTASTNWPRSSRSRRSRRSSTARTCCELDGRMQPLLGHDSAPQPARPAGHRTDAPQAERAGAQDPARGPLGGARCRANSTAPPSATGSTAGCASAPRGAWCEIAARTIWGADSGDISLLFALWYVHAAGGLRPADRRRGRRPAGPVRRRLAAHRPAAGGGARRSRHARRCRSPRGLGRQWRAGRCGRDRPWQRSARSWRWRPRCARASRSSPASAPPGPSLPSACRGARISSARPSTTSRSGARTASRARVSQTSARRPPPSTTPHPAGRRAS